MGEYNRYQTRRLHEIGRQLVVATFYNEDIDLFWQRAWDEWMDVEPFPQPPNLEDGEYLVQCAAKLQVLQTKVDWLIWRKYPTAVCRGELLPEWVEYPHRVTLADLAEDLLEFLENISDEVIIIDDDSDTQKSDGDSSSDDLEDGDNNDESSEKSNDESSNDNSSELFSEEDDEETFMEVL
ncbi:hypothetical protein EST38_g8432 [Candolleomyces aberdarensis]|uniref:Uncharacterized protein n=1 Tax=Candolleomyces aberdarensis TaxID=2316362 RepID=A0A4Q2DEA6_9AGAR|nr:hypothetical protein EST38_g8432 [Candolleomyces aberdarensis]